MFGRRAPAGRPATVMANVHAEAVLIADRDAPAIARETALRSATGRTLQGFSGTVVGYDRGDPANSYMGVVPGGNRPTAAYARIGMRDTQRLPNGEIYDAGTTNEELNAYQAAMLARIAR